MTNSDIKIKFNLNVLNLFYFHWYLTSILGTDGNVFKHLKPDLRYTIVNTQSRQNNKFSTSGMKTAEISCKQVGQHL